VVEFALVLPVLLVLTLFTLDFGRIYLGYINLQNMARIAANFAANNPDAWGATPDTAAQTKYRSQIVADASATNCSLPTDGSGNPTVPTPVFIDTNGDGTTDGLGDQAQVHITCSFGVITPIISAIVGGTVTVGAESNFPVKAGAVAFAGGGGGGSAPVAAFTGNGVVSGPAVSISGVVPFTVDFRDTSGGNPTSWSWDLGDPGITGGQFISVQDPGPTVYTTTGSYVVQLTAINIKGTSTSTMTVKVVATSTVNFTASPTTGTAPLAVTFTDASAPGGTAYAWTFGAGEGTGTGVTTTHTYNTVGTFAVSLTVTYPAPTGNVTLTKVNLITVSAKLCTVPNLFNVAWNQAQKNSGLWVTAGFTASNLSVGPGNPIANGNSWQVKSQTLVATSQVPCSATMQVNDH
jgi:PKD repeat protein